jgi:hypothetical protein
MFQAEVDKSKNLLKFTFSEHVTPDETHRWREQLGGLLGELQPGFKLLSDFSPLESMDFACAPDIEAAMEMCDKAGIAKVVRIMTDPRKDIGFSIMSLFHYRRRIPIVTCVTMQEALKALED